MVRDRAGRTACHRLLERPQAPLCLGAQTAPSHPTSSRYRSNAESRIDLADAPLSANLLGFPILSAGLGLLLVSSVSANGVLARVRIPGAATLAVLAYSLFLTHKAVMHLDRLLLADWLPLEGITGLAIYGASSCAVAVAL